jgi:GxxExxY protein
MPKSQGYSSSITKTRKEESTKRGNRLREIDFDEMNFEAIEREKETHEFEDLSRRIIGAALEVHRELGPGFLESIYEEALKIDLSEHDLCFEAQKEIKIEYLGLGVGLHRLDLVVKNQIIVELKAVKELTDVHFAQLRSYLKATGLKVGLLLNFAKPKLEIRRVVN